APFAAVRTATLDRIQEDTVTARYGQTSSRIGISAGVNLGAHSDVRVGTWIGRATTSTEVGDPGLPELRGKETAADLTWRVDRQDSPAVPSRGTFSKMQ